MSGLVKKGPPKRRRHKHRGEGQAKCRYCRRAVKFTPEKVQLQATKDHVVPKCKGGRKTVLSCRQCNNLKGSMSPRLWRRFMRENPEWWKVFETLGQLPPYWRMANMGQLKEAAQ